MPAATIGAVFFGVTFAVASNFARYVLCPALHSRNVTKEHTIDIIDDRLIVLLLILLPLLLQLQRSVSYCSD